MTQVLNTPPDRRGLPGWVPDAARHYVSHVEMGQPIRALARSAECHASTILRQIRRLETRRDDPLVDDALDLVGLPRSFAQRYPHELSGGQRQRVGIARAMILKPKLVICDEAVSALDVSIRAQIIDLLIDLQKEMGLAMIFISHDLAVVREISHRVMVLFLGRVMEMADRDRLYAEPQHPYTRALLSAAPLPDPEREGNRQRLKLTGEPPSPMDPAAALRFLPSRVSVDPLAPLYVPRLNEVAPGHLVSEFDVDWENRGAA